MKRKAIKYSVVMLIDDNEIDNFINERIIKGNTFAETVYINSGTKSAIEFLKNLSTLDSGGSLFPDLIFLDINMPLMDGFVFVEEFEKIRIKEKKTDIILLTSSLNPEDLNKSKKYNQIKEFVRKPLTDATLATL